MYSWHRLASQCSERSVVVVITVEFCNVRRSDIKFYFHDRKVAYDVTHVARKKWLSKSYNLCWKGIEQTPTFGVILKTNEKLIKDWNKLLLVCCSETRNLTKSNLVETRSFSWLV